MCVRECAFGLFFLITGLSSSLLIVKFPRDSNADSYFTPDILIGSLIWISLRVPVVLAGSSASRCIRRLYLSRHGRSARHQVEFREPEERARRRPSRIRSQPSPQVGTRDPFNAFIKALKILQLVADFSRLNVASANVHGYTKICGLSDQPEYQHACSWKRLG